MNDVNVALGEAGGGGVAHSFNCHPIWRVCALLTHLSVHFLSGLSFLFVPCINLKF